MRFDKGPPDADGEGAWEGSDADLVKRLVNKRFEGDEWRAVEAALVAVAVPVLHDVLLGGLLAPKSLALNRPVVPTAEETAALRQDVDARIDLVHAAVVEGIRQFCRLTLEGRGWQPDGGASLVTYVVNGCVRALNNPFRSWRARRARTPSTEPLPGEEVTGHPMSAQPDALAQLIAEEDWKALLASMPPNLAQAARLWRLTGWPWARIAGELGISERSLEGLKSRWRKQHRPPEEDAS